MKTRKIFYIIAIFIMSCSLTGFAASFSDTNGHWAESVIEKWNGKGVIQGYDGKFAPDNSIIRGDMAVILNRVMNYSAKSDNVFTDLDNNAYYTEAILKLNKAGVMLGADGCVRPEDFITREEAFVMLNRIYNFKGEALTTGFEDETNISDWAKEAILAMCENKIINGSSGKINPKLNITRAEIIQLLENISSYLDRIANEAEGELEIESENDKKGNTSGGSSRPSGGSSGNTGGNEGSDGNEGESGNTGGSEDGNGNEGESGNTGGSSDNTNDDSAQEPEDDTENSIGSDDIEVGGIW